MTDENSARIGKPPGALVAVIASPTALARATRLRHPPDLFELRLDALRHSLGEIARALPKLRAPLLSPPDIRRKAASANSASPSGARSCGISSRTQPSSISNSGRLAK